MTTLSLLAGNSGRGRGGEEWGLRVGSRLHIGNVFFAGDTLKSLSRSLNGVWMKDFERVRVRGGNKFRVAAKVRKGKKHDYPWPDDIDPNSSTGPLTYLSYFKPLTEKPKPVTLAFEKPLVDLEKKIIEVRRMADETGLDFSDQISALEINYKQVSVPCTNMLAIVTVRCGHLVGTKLQVVITKMGLRIEDRGEVVRGVPNLPFLMLLTLMYIYSIIFLICEAWVKYW